MIINRSIVQSNSTFQTIAIQTEMGFGPPGFSAAQATPVPMADGTVTTAMMIKPITHSIIGSCAMLAKAPPRVAITPSDEKPAVQNAVMRYFLRIGVSLEWALVTQTGHKWMFGGKKKSQVTHEPLPHTLQNATGGSAGCCGQPRCWALVAGPWNAETEGVGAAAA